MSFRFAESPPDAAGFVNLEQLASEPYSSFVYEDAPQSRAIADALLAKCVGEFAPPFGRALLDADGRTVGILAGPLSRKDLARTRMQAAQLIHKSGVLAASPAVAARSKIARGSLLTLTDEHQYLSRIAVDPAARGKGAARFLLDAFLAAARQRGGTRAVLEVSPSAVAAVRLYENAGFETVGEVKVEDLESGRTLVYRHMVCAL